MVYIQHACTFVGRSQHKIIYVCCCWIRMCTRVHMFAHHLHHCCDHIWWKEKKSTAQSGRPCHCTIFLMYVCRPSRLNTTRAFIHPFTYKKWMQISTWLHSAQCTWHKRISFEQLTENVYHSLHVDTWDTSKYQTNSSNFHLESKKNGLEIHFSGKCIQRIRSIQTSCVVSKSTHCLYYLVLVINCAAIYAANAK